MKIVMFSEKGPRNTGEQNESQEQLNLERQKNKLVGFYMSGGDERYIFESNRDEFNEDKRTPEDREDAYKAILGDASREDREWKFLTRIAGPDYWHSTDEIFEGMADDKHQKRILGYMTGMKWGMHDYTSGRNIAEFLRRFPTPKDFDVQADNFLHIIDDNNGRQKAEEYAEAMEEFQQRVYGKKYEYYKAMKELHEEATTAKDYTAEIPREVYERREPNFSEFFERDPVVEDAGMATLNKGMLVGNPNRLNEDAVYYNPEMGLFGVFDGAGGERGAALASGLARDTMIRAADQGMPETVQELAKILADANEEIAGRGVSTAVVGRILEKDGRKALLWASVGDSRIYLVRNGVKDAFQVTEDEGEGNRLWYGLGHNFKVRQVGELPLMDGDRVVFCSDGVTGDYEPDFIPNDEFASIVGGAETADLAAWSLINRATKRDDRTAIVVEV